ncbi:hypothetical protein EHQ12_01450 [Leptospira gomenensis]|uniref:Uncharacterized protein n=1 Tax=Leptospira gomenensis TaxID=2484974 RepID=A0A5F1Z087_9LEPT|nr:hypothetical protein [Leptospira gomenensis]TGK34479.1 hypothetical protein EHQ17_08615 [Leptospira gomenensis]TGK41865.1 hypothetical protein EHQ07_15585 [Leptospira gomenensis]TGK44802.1 hypothetical protein EHQ12_01450 [Leptospira gomenensis]TGK65189.1 hypothetical protein EHQ13_05965 [Leptospira gomenensis]
MQYVQSLRTSLSWNEICEQIVLTTKGTVVQILENVAVIQSEEVEIKLEYMPFNPRRETDCNLRTSFTESKEDKTGIRLIEWQKLLRSLETHVGIQCIDHYYLHSKISLKQFCAKIEEIFRTFSFDFDFEDANEWAIAETDDFILSISKTYRRNSFHEWNPKECPPGCNYSLRCTVKATDREDWNQTLYREIWFPRWKEFFVKCSCSSVVRLWKSPIHS